MRKLLFSLIASRLLSRHAGARRVGRARTGNRLRVLLSAFLAARRRKLGAAQTLRHLVLSQFGTGRGV